MQSRIDLSIQKKFLFSLRWKGEEERRQHHHAWCIDSEQTHILGVPPQIDKEVDEER